MDTASTLSTVEAFLQASGMTPTAFGREALGDPRFVPDLRKGRRIWPETAEKVLTYIRHHPPSVSAVQ